MRRPAKYRELPKVLIERYQDASVVVGARKNDFIAGIFRPVTRPHHIVAYGCQLTFGSWGQAGVQKELQVPALIVRGSMRSLAAILRA